VLSTARVRSTSISFVPGGAATAGLEGAYGASDRRVCVLSTESRAEAEAGAEAAAEADAAGAAGREASEGSAARRFREGPLEQLRLELQVAHVS